MEPTPSPRGEGAEGTTAGEGAFALESAISNRLCALQLLGRPSRLVTRRQPPLSFILQTSYFFGRFLRLRLVVQLAKVNEAARNRLGGRNFQ